MSGKYDKSGTEVDMFCFLGGAMAEDLTNWYFKRQTFNLFPETDGGTPIKDFH